MLDRLTARVSELVDCEDAFGFKVKLVVKGLGCIVVDGTNYPIAVSNSDAEAAATLKLDGDVLAQLLDGGLSPLTAFMSGRIQVDGDLGKAMQLSRLFG